MEINDDTAGVWSRDVLGLVWWGESARCTFDSRRAGSILDGQLGGRSANWADHVPINRAKRSVISDIIGKHDATAVPNNGLRKLRDCGRRDAEHHGSNHGCCIWDMYDLGRDKFDTDLCPLNANYKPSTKPGQLHSRGPQR